MSWKHEVLLEICYIQNCVWPVGILGVSELEAKLDVYLAINMIMLIISLSRMSVYCGVPPTLNIYKLIYMAHRHLCANSTL